MNKFLKKEIFRWCVSPTIVSLFFSFSLSAQHLLYEDCFKGGVTGNGASYSYGSTQTLLNFSINIPAGSTIRKAYLIAGQIGDATITPLTVTLNGTPHIFNSATAVTTFQIPIVNFNPGWGGPASVHAIDVTATLNPAITNYTLDVPAQTTGKNYTEFYLYVAYNNATLPYVGTSVFLNEQNMGGQLTYSLSPQGNIYNSADVSLALLTGFICNDLTSTGGDAEFVNVNGIALGKLGGQDSNGPPGMMCGGPIGSFEYYNQTVMALQDDNVDQAMQKSDALSNIKNIVPVKSNNVQIVLTHNKNGIPNDAVSDNNIWAFFMAYKGYSTDTTYTVGSCGNNGSATIEACGGEQPLNYFWNNGQTTQTAIGLSPGTYSVIVIDALGDSLYESVTVPSVNALDFVTTVNDATCADNDGTALAWSITGGSGVYNYSWSTGANTASISNLVSGTYSVTVSDNSGCSKQKTVTITTPVSFTFNVLNLQHVSCSDDSSGAITIAGNGSGAYSFSWNFGSGSPILTGLSAGTYSVHVTDITTGCERDTVFILTQPPELTAQLNSQYNSCLSNAGQINASVNGGTPAYQYSWSNGATTLGVSSLASGTYTLTVTDNKSCSVTASVSLTQPPGITVSSVVSSESCLMMDDGSIVLTAMGGDNNFSYTWSPLVSVTNNAIGLQAGNYTVIVSDGSGCVDTSTFVITTLPGPIFDAGPDQEIISGESVVIGQSISNANIMWTPSMFLSCNNCEEPIATPTATITYYITVTDTNGCSVMDSITVEVKNNCDELYIPTAFSPNTDHFNDQFMTRGGCWKEFGLQIFNRWGQLVFETIDDNQAWDGKSNGNLCDPGVYVYLLNGISMKNEVINTKGNLTLVR